MCSLGRCCDVFVDGSWRGEKLLNLKQIADGAMAICDEKLVLVYCCYTSHWLWCSLTDKLFVINVQSCSLCTSTATCRKWPIENSKNDQPWQDLASVNVLQNNQETKHTVWVNSQTGLSERYIQKKTKIRQKTERAWSSHTLWYPAETHFGSRLGSFIES